MRPMREKVKRSRPSFAPSAPVRLSPEELRAAGEAALAARREINRQVSQMEEGPCCAVCGRADR